MASAGGRLEAELTRGRGGELVRLPLDRKEPCTLLANAARLEAADPPRGVASSTPARARPPGRPLMGRAADGSALRDHLPRGLQRPIGAEAAVQPGDGPRRPVIANSAFTRDHLTRRAPGSIRRGWSPSPAASTSPRFDPERGERRRVAALRAAWGLAADDARLVLLLAGRLTRWKGQALLIDALASLRGARTPVLVLAGDDQGRTAYRDSLRAATAEARAWRTRAHRRPLRRHARRLPGADLACAPSLDPEAFGRTAVEPQAMGRPVLAADHGAVRETVVDGVTGWRVAPARCGRLGRRAGPLLAASPDRRARHGRAGPRAGASALLAEAHDRGDAGRLSRACWRSGDTAGLRPRPRDQARAHCGDVVQALRPLRAHPRRPILTPS